MNEQISSDRPPARRGRGRAVAVLAVVALAGGLAGAFATKSLGQAYPPWHMTVMGAGDGLHGPFGGPLTAEQIATHADHAVRHFAIEIDASADQTTKLEAIVKGAITDIVPVREKIAAARQQARMLLTAPNVDRAAIEKLRAEQVANVDTVTKRITQAVGDAAEVLTPEQRRKIGDMLPPPGERRGGWGMWHRG